jgi:hypothetical protein
MTMKRFAVSAFAICAGIATSLPAVAQQGAAPLPGETAMEMAVRVNACDDAGIVGAQFIEGGNTLQVQCGSGVSGMEGGLGATGAAAAAGLVLVAVALGGDSSSGTTGTTGTGNAAD